MSPLSVLTVYPSLFIYPRPFSLVDHLAATSMLGIISQIRTYLLDGLILHFSILLQCVCVNVCVCEVAFK